MIGKKTAVVPKDPLLEELARTKSAMDTAYSNFENVTEPDLIDCYIYELNAAQMRYKFLLKKVKESSAY
ncbi:MAG: YaaL family protein [Lachnospiraceae bacterium]|nr:YaaL family protein [Lachnospiraceae bacterium]MDE5782175.1 YaaL family protein [Lachnospiraceae bacterium]MDE6233977.1 YaaL family protein [Lachnospiraceae bacterium]MDE6251567.1 YaaL family protein [Lachnospiraceae bacterium]